MRCQECDQPATIHITEARQHVAVSESHLCEPHATQYLQRYAVEAEGTRWNLPRQQPPSEGILPASAVTGFASGPVSRREIRCEIVRVVISEVHDQQVAVLREEGGRRIMPLVCGIFEATSLDRRLKQMSSPRPLTHDAWADTITALGGEVQDVLVSDLQEYTYYAQVRIRRGDHYVAVDVRPSDAYIIGLRCRVPILVAEWLLDTVGG